MGFDSRGVAGATGSVRRTPMSLYERTKQMLVVKLPEPQAAPTELLMAYIERIRQMFEGTVACLARDHYGLFQHTERLGHEAQRRLSYMGKPIQTVSIIFHRRCILLWADRACGLSDVET